MAANLVKDWILYLKNNKIVAFQSDPTSGKLSYNRAVTPDDVSTFLEAKSEFSPEQISNAIHMVLAKKAQGGGKPKLQNNPAPQEPPQPAKTSTDLSTWMHNGMRPVGPTNRLTGEPAEQPKQVSGNPNSKLNYDPNSVSDIDYKDIPNKKPEALPAPQQEPEEPKRKPRFKYRSKGLNEDFEDMPGYELDEKDVEQIFNILTSGQADAKSEPASTATRQPASTPAVNKVEELNKLKRAIRDTMSDQQRKALWRALNEI